MSEQHIRWVRDEQVVRGFGAYIGAREHGAQFVGKAIAYQPAPTLLVELPDGSRISWAAHLCEPAERPPQPPASGPWWP